MEEVSQLPCLPGEIWVQIFRHLDTQTVHKKASLVCQSWYSIIRNDQGLSGQLRLTQRYLSSRFKQGHGRVFFSDKEVQRGIEKMLRNWPKLQTLELQVFAINQDLTFEPSEAVFKMFVDSLESTNLKNVVVKTSLETFLGHFQSFQEIRYSTDDVPDQFQVPCLKIGLPDSFSDWNQVPSSWLKTAFDSSLAFVSKVETLSINSDFDITDFSCKTSMQDFLHQVQDSLVKIEIHFQGWQNNFSFDLFERHCPKMNTLVLNCLSGTFNQHFFSTVQSSTQIEKIILLHGYLPNFGQWMQINDHLKHFQVGHFNYLTSSDLLQIAQKYRKLETLQVNIVDMKITAKELEQFLLEFQAVQSLLKLDLGLLQVKQADDEIEFFQRISHIISTRFATKLRVKISMLFDQESGSKSKLVQLAKEEEKSLQMIELQSFIVPSDVALSLIQ